MWGMAVAGSVCGTSCGDCCLTPTCTARDGEVKGDLPTRWALAGDTVDGVPMTLGVINLTGRVLPREGT